MQKNLLPDGLWPVMLTPFLENNEIDWSSLERLTEFYIKSGAAGLFSICLSSEMFQLTDDEKIKITTAVFKLADLHGLKVVSSGTFSPDLQKCADHIHRVYDAGAAAVILLTNQLAAFEDEEEILKKNIEEFLHLTDDIPLGIYECPYPYKRLLSTDMMKWLADTGRFFYHKDTSCNPVMIKEKIQGVKDSSLSFFNANTATALISLRDGGNGFSPIGANFYPELYAWMFNEFNSQGVTPELQRLNDQLNIMENIIAYGYPQSAKIFLQSRNLNLTTTCRIQHSLLKSEDYIKLKSLEQNFNRLKSEYGL